MYSKKVCITYLNVILFCIYIHRIRQSVEVRKVMTNGVRCTNSVRISPTNGNCNHQSQQSKTIIKMLYQQMILKTSLQKVELTQPTLNLNPQYTIPILCED